MEIEVQPSTSAASGSDSEDSDKELLIAYEKGWLKPGLNFAERVARPKINNVPALERKLQELQTPELPWIERMNVSVPKDMPPGAGGAVDEDREDDFVRETAFYNMALKAVEAGVVKLNKLGVPVERPEDYFAQMAKSDQHMDKVRSKLISLQKKEEKTQLVRKMRQEKKFAVQKQKDALEEKRLERKQLQDAVKKHKKGMKEQLSSILDKKKLSKGSIRKKRAAKDKKYGFGGKKRGMKTNTAASSADIFGGRKSKKGNRKPKKN